MVGTPPRDLLPTGSGPLHQQHVLQGMHVKVHAAKDVLSCDISRVTQVDWLSTFWRGTREGCQIQILLQILRKAVIPMIFFSTLLRKSIYDSEGRRLGVLRDMYVTLNETFPVVNALVVRSTSGNHDLIIPWSQVHSLEEPQIYLTVKRQQLVSYTPPT